MLSTELMEHITQIRRADYTLPSQPEECFSPIADISCVEDSQYITQLLMLLQESERLCLKNTTKYLAKKYFDIFLSKYPQFPNQNSILLIITCLRTAAKFNQNVQIHELYTIDFCIDQSGGKYAKESFVQCQIELLRALSFKLKMTSPYDFVIVQCLLPHLKQAMNILNSIIDFSLSLRELKNASAEGIFFGALLYSCKEKNENPLYFNIISAITFKWQQAIQIASILDENLKRILRE